MITDILRGTLLALEDTTRTLYNRATLTLPSPMQNLEPIARLQKTSFVAQHVAWA